MQCRDVSERYPFLWEGKREDPVVMLIWGRKTDQTFTDPSGQFGTLHVSKPLSENKEQ